MARRRRLFNFGNVSVGSTETPTALKSEEATVSEAAQEELREKVDEYRKENPEKPKDTTPLLQTPLSIKRNTVSFDDEYIELAKRYLGIKGNVKPTMVDFAKGIIRLFEDNVKMYKAVGKMAKTAGNSTGSPLGSREDGGSWN